MISLRVRVPFELVFEYDGKNKSETYHYIAERKFIIPDLEKEVLKNVITFLRFVSDLPEMDFLKILEKVALKTDIISKFDAAENEKIIANANSFISKYETADMEEPSPSRSIQLTRSFEKKDNDDLSDYEKHAVEIADMNERTKMKRYVLEHMCDPVKKKIGFIGMENNELEFQLECHKYIRKYADVCLAYASLEEMILSVFSDEWDIIPMEFDF